MVKRTIELKIELESLNKEELDFHFIKNFKCQTEEEFKVFIKENAIAFDRLKFIKSRIRKIENELM